MRRTSIGKLLPKNLFEDHRTQTDRRRLLNETLLLGCLAGIGTAGLALVFGGESASLLLTLSLLVGLSHNLRVRSAQRAHREAILWGRSLHDMGTLRAWLPEAAQLDLVRPWAVLPDQACLLLQTQRALAPDTIVDLGSGTSTILMAALCRQMGSGHVYSVDHDSIYAEATERELHRLDLGQYATVIHAPLQTFSGAAPAGLAEHPSPWYSAALLEQLPDRIDMLFVDGPPANVGPDSRFPAVPMFADRIPTGGVVMLDDARRPSEQRTAAGWVMVDPGFELSWVGTYAGTAKLIRQRGQKSTSKASG